MDACYSCTKVFGLGPMQTCKSGPIIAVLHEKKQLNEGWNPYRRHSGANHAVFHAQNDRSCLGPIETCYSGPIVAVLHPKTTDAGWDP